MQPSAPSRWFDRSGCWRRVRRRRPRCRSRRELRRAATIARAASLISSVLPKESSGTSEPVPGPYSRPKRRTIPRRPGPVKPVTARSAVDRRLQVVGKVVPDRGRLVRRTWRVDEGDGGHQEQPDRCIHGGTRQNRGALAAEAVVLGPAFTLAPCLGGRDPGGQMEHGVHRSNGGAYRFDVKEVEI